MKDEQKRDVAHAYQAVRIYYLSQSKKRMPKLSDLIDEIDARGRGRKVHNAAQHRASLEILSQMYGGKLTLVKSRKKRRA